MQDGGIIYALRGRHDGGIIYARWRNNLCIVYDVIIIFIIIIIIIIIIHV